MIGPFARFDGHEQVVFARDDDVGLTCIVAIHSTRLGPSLGGTRFLPYATEEEALTDVLRLSRAMTYKNACAGIDHGGGKAVIIGDPAELRSEGLLRAYGRVIAGLAGRYISACDVGTTPDDMAVIGRETRWVTGMDETDGGSGDSGVLTAYGVYLAMRAAAGAAYGEESLAGRHVAVQGLGKVGLRLVHHLLDDGAHVTVADVSPEAVDRAAGLRGVEVASVDDILRTDADIVSPNALGGVLNEHSIPSLQATVVCGGANNQLASDGDARRLADRGILYAPDYVVSGGGVINVADELHPGGHSPARARRRAERIPHTLHDIIEVSRREGVTTEEAASRVAERRIASVGAVSGYWLP